jgi:hypothetical protein
LCAGVDDGGGIVTIDNPERDRDAPRSDSKGHVEQGDILLTNSIWRSAGDYCRGAPETGIRFKQKDGTFGDFHLFQHGWNDFDKVNAILLKGLAKGWKLGRIENLIEFLRDRR